jgi:hypothetical protein
MLARNAGIVKYDPIIPVEKKSGEEYNNHVLGPMLLDYEGRIYHDQK